MITIRIFDSESNGLWEQANTLWCIAAVDYSEVIQYNQEPVLFTPTKVEKGLDYLHEADVLVAHNCIGHDLPLFKKLYGWEPLPSQIVIDTLVFSRLMMPARPLPYGYEGKGGPHSIEAWGYRVGMWKPEHEDWSQYSTAMGKRCMMDTKINLLTLKELEKEAGEEMYYHAVA